MKNLLITIVILMVIITAFTIFSIYFSNDNNNKYTKAIIAKVVNVIEKRQTTGTKFPRTTYYYLLEVEYEINHETIKTTCNGSQSLYNKNKVGDEIEVLYNPNDINKCKLI